MSQVDVIVIGGSAGALDALVAILPGLPDALDTPIIVVLHLPPGQRSLVPELLGRLCRRPVREIEDKQPLAARAIYVAPPDYHVLVERDGSLALSVDDPVNFSRPSIDVLFESAVDAFGAGVAGLVLSGSSTDGAEGLRCILAAGGIAAVQDPASAPQPTMPASALARARTARVVGAAELPAFLGSIAGLGDPLQQGARP